MPYYIKFGKPDIKGPVTTKGYKDQFEVSSFNFSFDKPIEMKLGHAVQSWTKGLVYGSGVSFGRAKDMASPSLFNWAHGQDKNKPVTVEISWVELEGGKAELVMSLKLGGCVVVGYSEVENAETFQLSCATMQLDYRKKGRFAYDLCKQTTEVK